jgi:membrane protein DedA with SNARE-associated domain
VAVHDLLFRLIHSLGPIGVGLGAGLEGETAVVVGGLLARHGAFSPVSAGLAAWLGSFLADQIFFALGRWQRQGRLVVRVSAKPAFARALALIDRHPLPFCLAFRFVYGFRVAGPVAIGVSQVPARLFLALNLIMAALWAGLFTFLGFRFGQDVERVLRRLLTPTHGALLLGLLAAGCAIFLIAGAARAPALADGSNAEPNEIG